MFCFEPSNKRSLPRHSVPQAYDTGPTIPTVRFKPRPVHLRYAFPNNQWQRTTESTQHNLINRFQPVASGDG